MAKVDRQADFGCAAALELEARSDKGSPPESAISCGPCQTVTFIRAWADQNERQLRHLHTDVCLLTRTSPRAMRGGPEASLTEGGIGGTKSTLGTNHWRNCAGSAAAGRTEPLKLSPQIVVVA